MDPLKAKIQDMGTLNNISLPDELDRYVRERVESGLYEDSGELVREALRQKMFAEMSDAEKLAALKAEIDIGWEQAERGELVKLDMDAIHAELDAELNG